MFLNIFFKNAKSWKPYWVTINGQFMDISTDYGKDIIASFHIGVMKVRPSKDYPDRPDVLEFYPGDENLTFAGFHVFTYDPFDILKFFKDICSAYKSWRDDVAARMTPIITSRDIKSSAIFASSNTWKVEKDKIVVMRSNQLQSTIPLSENYRFTTKYDKPYTFAAQVKEGENGQDQKCQNIADMKELLNAIYTNAFILKLQSQTPAPQAAAEERHEPAQAPAAE